MPKNIKLFSEVPIELEQFRIGHSDPIFLLGSCFTENMGNRLEDLNFQSMMNPFGIQYNPLSMATALYYCMEDRRVGEEDLILRDDLWHSWLHHGSFSRRDKQECLDACNQTISDAHIFLQTCNTVIITFGSAWYYQLSDNYQSSIPNHQFPKIVANCHKVPAAYFEKHLATVDQVVEAWSPLVDGLMKRGTRIIFTISPVRHNAYGAHGNQLGKAVLLLAIEKLISRYRNPDNSDQDSTLPSWANTKSEYRILDSQLAYFPVYEIVVDELRDYRFYADDMAHPSPLAEQIVWQRFQETFMTQDTIDRCNDYEKTNRRNAHRQIHGNS